MILPPPISTPTHTEYHPQTVSSGVVFSSPHSGSWFPDEFLESAALPMRWLRSSEDAFVDGLYDAAPEHGASLLAARVSRAVVDLNRAPDELDPALVQGIPPIRHNPRISAGLGVIPRVVSQSRVIRSGKMDLAQAKAVISRYYAPYHARLSELLAQRKATFGEALLVDCHSMPDVALSSMGKGMRDIDIVLGDAHGASAHPRISEAVEGILEDAGFRVRRNVPFSGGFITRNYGTPSNGIHAVQIEIRRSLYMQEDPLARHQGFDRIRDRIGVVLPQICALVQDQGQALAAQ